MLVIVDTTVNTSPLITATHENTRQYF